MSYIEDIWGEPRGREPTEFVREQVYGLPLPGFEQEEEVSEQPKERTFTSCPSCSTVQGCYEVRQERCKFCYGYLFPNLFPDQQVRIEYFESLASPNEKMPVLFSPPNADLRDRLREFARSAIRKLKDNEPTEEEIRRELCTFGEFWRYCSRCNPKMAHLRNADSNKNEGEECTKDDLKRGLAYVKESMDFSDSDDDSFLEEQISDMLKKEKKNACVNTLDMKEEILALLEKLSDTAETKNQGIPEDKDCNPVSSMMKENQSLTPEVASIASNSATDKNIQFENRKGFVGISQDKKYDYSSHKLNTRNEPPKKPEMIKDTKLLYAKSKEGQFMNRAKTVGISESENFDYTLKQQAIKKNFGVFNPTNLSHPSNYDSLSSKKLNVPQKIPNKIKDAKLSNASSSATKNVGIPESESCESFSQKQNTMSIKDEVLKKPDKIEKKNDGVNTHDIKERIMALKKLYDISVTSQVMTPTKIAGTIPKNKDWNSESRMAMERQEMRPDAKSVMSVKPMSSPKTNNRSDSRTLHVEYRRHPIKKSIQKITTKDGVSTCEDIPIPSSLSFEQVFNSVNKPNSPKIESKTTTTSEGHFKKPQIPSNFPFNQALNVGVNKPNSPKIETKTTATSPDHFKKPQIPSNFPFNQALNVGVNKPNSPKIETKTTATSPDRFKKPQIPSSFPFNQALNVGVNKPNSPKIETKTTATSPDHFKKPQIPSSFPFNQALNVGVNKPNSPKIETKTTATSPNHLKKPQPPSDRSFDQNKTNLDMKNPVKPVNPIPNESKTKIMLVSPETFSETTCERSFDCNKSNLSTEKIVSVETENKAKVILVSSKTIAEIAKKESSDPKRLNLNTVNIVSRKKENETEVMPSSSKIFTGIAKKESSDPKGFNLNTVNIVSTKKENESEVMPSSSKIFTGIAKKESSDPKRFNLNTVNIVSTKKENETEVMPSSSKIFTGIAKKESSDPKKFNLNTVNIVSTKKENESEVMPSSCKIFTGAIKNTSLDQNPHLNIPNLKIDDEKQTTAITVLPLSKKLHESTQMPLKRKLEYPVLCRNDVECLPSKNLLNDTIIEFYLKYIYNEKLSPEVQQKTYICSTFFYPKVLKELEQEETAESIKSWLKDIDLFSKDFILIPVNVKFSHEVKHWYLVIVCYLSKMDKKPLYDTNSGTACNVETQSDSSYSKDTNKRPCICFFDSAYAEKSLGREKIKVAKNLKNFFKTLWLSSENNETCEWSQLVSYNVVCPQQANWHDCGVFLLQFAESFFETPIDKYEDQLNVTHWCDQNKITNKRKEILKIIVDIIRKKM